ncbi:diguanylate cyclase [Rhizomicrobium palustre]|uniref:diguanylate cyclase n=1 Tax=Rhizomicrobium palustre TaxID=189966 RepID=A0A846N1S1_9PROT|nr:diguanylate cyclase [Rhizomicrobium palustre]
MAGQSREQALAKAAFALMADFNVAPTPDHYELFFVYAAGNNPALSRTVETMIRERAPFTGPVLQDLCARFLIRERTAQTMEEVGSSISGMIDAVMSKLEKAGKDAGEYGRALSAVSGELGGNQSPAAVAKLIDKLVGATQAMETRAKSLETELQRSSAQVNELKNQLDTVRKESRLDPLTGLANRKAFDIELQAAIDDARETNTSVALMMCDIDHFKRFNDTWGHQTGDQVLRLVSGCLSENVKGRDTAARYGGEEFAVILRRTELTGAIKLASQIRSNVENKKLVKRSTGDILGTITISIGVAELGQNDTAEKLVQRADQCLYKAKNSGRNRVTAEDELISAINAA